MKLFEFESPAVDTQRLMALSQLLLSRANDTSAKKTFDLSAFLQLASNMGINLSAEQLKNQSLLPPLSNVIDDVQIDPANPESGKIYFKGAEAPPSPGEDKMTVDQARDTVNKMAKRANKL